MYHKMNTIRSSNSELGSCEPNKVPLSCFDDKRYVQENGITSYAYGHYKIYENIGICYVCNIIFFLKII